MAAADPLVLLGLTAALALPCGVGAVRRRVRGVRIRRRLRVWVAEARRVVREARACPYAACTDPDWAPDVAFCAWCRQLEGGAPCAR